MRAADLLQESPIGSQLPMAQAASSIQEAMAPCDLQDRFEIARHADLMDAQERRASRVDRGFRLLRIHVVGARLDIDEHRLRAAIPDRIGRRDVGVAYGDDFIARSDA